jgi:hypothetical protein
MILRRGTWSTLIMAVLAPTFGCGGGTSTQPNQPSGSGAASASARAYMDEVLGLMQAHSLNRLTVDWSDLRATVIARAGDARNAAATYPALGFGVSLLGDQHSTFVGADAFVYTPRNRQCGAPDAPVPSVPSTIGYVKVPSFSGLGAEAAAFANGVQSTIAAADAAGVTGWLVDLRGNLGGNMWPMVAGLGPLLGEGTIGYFIDPAGTETPWAYRDGASWEGDVAAQRVDAPYRLRREHPRIAVLVDGRVASSGEATAIAFRGMPEARSFGASTCGLSTAIENYRISDGAMLNLAIAVMADRTKMKYGSGLAPDEFIVDPAQQVERAVTWLQSGS